jgi:predicted nucleic acid-binding protein
MSGEAALLDVNVPMYAAGQAHRYKVPCAWVMREIAEGRLAAAIDTEAVQEILYRYGALQQWSIAVRMATNVLDIVPTVLPVQEADARLAVALLQRYGPVGVKARDLIHVAVMQNHGLTDIISTDTHFDLIEGITRLDPQRLFDQRSDDGIPSREQ